MALKVKQDEDNPVPAEVLATAIEQIAASMKKIEGTRLSRKALIALIHDDTKLTKGTVETVLKSLEDLERTYLKKR